jgi:hypothetical protein
MYRVFFSLLLLSTALFSENNEDVHGFVDVLFKNDYITPRGLLDTNTGLTTQINVGLSLDLYKNPSNFLNSLSIVGFVWNDLWSKQHHPKVESWNEMDWGVGFASRIAEDLRFDILFTQFLSPPGNFRPENNIETTLAYEDRRWRPFAFNPYVRWFWAVSGDSTVVVGKRGRTFDVEIGMLPTFDFQHFNFPLILKAPTWITVGPASFWNGGKLGIKSERSNCGVFSTGLKGEIPLGFIPKRIGAWYIDVGVQYYHLINDNLLKAQTITLHKPFLHNTHRNIVVAAAGIGFRF